MHCPAAQVDEFAGADPRKLQALIERWVLHGSLVCLLMVDDSIHLYLPWLPASCRR